MPTDRRRFSRIQFDASAVLVRDGQRWPAQLEDISLKGALVNVADHSFAKDDQLVLEIQLNGDDLTLTMPAKLVHIEGQQLGLYAQQMTLEDVSHLRRLVELNLGDENLLERELEHLITPQN